MAERDNGNGKKTGSRTGEYTRRAASGASKRGGQYIRSSDGQKKARQQQSRQSYSRPASMRPKPVRSRYEEENRESRFVVFVRDVINGYAGRPVSSRKRYRKYSDKTMKKRNRIAMIAMCVCFALLVCVLGYYQLIDSEKWQQKAVEQQLQDTVLPAKRGTIYDRNMETMVQSATAWQVWIKKASLQEEQKDGVVQMLSDVLGLSEEYINGRLEINSSDISLRGKATKEQKDAIAAYVLDEEGKVKIPGVYWVADTKRYYYRGTLASTVLGFTNDGNTGAAGIEMKYNEELSGVAGRQIVATNAKSDAAMPFDYKLMVDPQEGSSLVLTIDATIQQYLEKNLAKAIKDNNVRNRACGIIMNVNTGEVLAMATLPDFDPSSYQTVADERTAAKIAEIKDEKKKAEAVTEAQNEQWRNKCINDTYEPGSVFKPITMTAALEEGVTDINDSFTCHGYLKVNGRKIHCARTSGHGSESLTKGMMNSCNPVFMTLASRLGASKFYQYFTAYGLMEKTGIDLPGEASGVMHTEKVLNRESDTLAVCSFGQSFKVTPIQMVTAIAAVSNGGYLVQPHVVSQVLDADGNILRRVETVVKRQVISEKTSKTVNTMLEKTVSGGTAKNGYVAGYRIGGKTGTSEKIQEQAETGVKKYIASYCAIAPSDDPEIVMLVLLDEPNGSVHTGGTIAAPVIRNTLKEVLPYLGIDTIYTSEDAALLDTVAPNVQGMALDEAKKMLDAKGLEYRVTGSGDRVTAQIPQGGKSLPKGSTVVLNTDDSEFATTTVPDVYGKNAGEANKAITNAKLNIRFAGTGYDSKAGVVVGQSIAAGTKVEQGTVVTVEFIESGIND